MLFYGVRPLSRGFRQKMLQSALQEGISPRSLSFANALGVVTAVWMASVRPSVGHHDHTTNGRNNDQGDVRQSHDCPTCKE